MQHGAGAGIEWVAVIKCVGCGMQHPGTHAPPDVNLYPNSEKRLKRVENPIEFCILGNIEKTHTAQYNKTIESNGHMTG